MEQILWDTRYSFHIYACWCWIDDEWWMNFAVTLASIFTIARSRSKELLSWKKFHHSLLWSCPMSCRGNRSHIGTRSADAGWRQLSSSWRGVISVARPGRQEAPPARPGQTVCVWHRVLYLVITGFTWVQAGAGEEEVGLSWGCVTFPSCIVRGLGDHAVC